jgi:hypothetical protein
MSVYKFGNRAPTVKTEFCKNQLALYSRPSVIHIPPVNIKLLRPYFRLIELII